MCSSSAEPFLAETQDDVAGAELNWLAYCQPENVLESATDTFNELPNVPGYLAINSPYPTPPVLYSPSYTSEFSINNASKVTVAFAVAVRV